MSGTLFLLPNLLDEDLPYQPFLPISIVEIVQSLDGIIAESEKGARRFIRRFVTHERLAAFPIKLLNEHTPISELKSLIDPIAKGERWGLVSDAGLPCMADPGAPLVMLAHELHLSVRAIPGPSSIVMALQLSGLNGQRFAFHGYLPREEELLRQKLSSLEKRSAQDEATQLWIETPYRFNKMAQIAIETLHPDTFLCIASGITSAEENVCTQKIFQWRKQKLDIAKVPAIFLLFKS